MAIWTPPIALAGAALGGSTGRGSVKWNLRYARPAGIELSGSIESPSIHLQREAEHGY
jgi:hypothetical protein